MSFNTGLAIGQEIDNKRLTEIFKCSPQGGMRKSNQTNTLVLVTDSSKLYHDRWVGDVLHYTGMGQFGDQELTRANRTLAESYSNGVEVHLFEVLEEGKYTYRGEVILVSKPYTSDQIGADGNLRKVWMFNLKTKTVFDSAISQNSLKEIEENFRKKATRLADAELLQKAKLATAQTSQRNAVATYYERDPNVAECALRKARGYCQLCAKPAPFLKSDATPFLETHHIIWLSNGGEDSLENTIALCPNCHRKMHILNRAEDVEILNMKAKVQ